MTVENSCRNFGRYDSFLERHIGPRDHEIEAMLGYLGLASLDDLADRVVPKSIRTSKPLALSDPMSEREALNALRDLAAKNRPCRSYIGMGYYGSVLPEVIKRNLLENPGWYTAYTPYQAEISQGRLEALLNFQQMVVDLTGLDTSNASLLDEATAAAEAMTLAMRVNKGNTRQFLIETSCHPQTIAVLKTRAKYLDIEIVEVENAADVSGLDVLGGIVQYPATTGGLSGIEERIQAIKAAGGLAIVATDLLALCLLTPPGEFGADVAVGSAQRFGVPMGFGGPHAAFFATSQRHRRAVPGRLIGVSIDDRGNTAYRMALQTREQHIRRDKATSNICTAQVLLAVISSMYAVYHGREGLEKRAQGVHQLASALALGVRNAGLHVRETAFFDTIVVEAPGRATEILDRAQKHDVELRCLGTDRVGISLDETTGFEDLRELLKIITDRNWTSSQTAEVVENAGSHIPDRLRRRSSFLDHPVFHQHRSETQMMRYLRRLQAKDIALDRSMIPLGSCTMKLNAASEMAPISWPEFADVHPFIGQEYSRGYRELIRDLEHKLAEITGFAAVSMQPNAGSQGEYCGLLTIRAYHADRRDAHRDICLIPSSAHGTNPASAVLAGMRVVVVGCDDQGNIDLDDLTTKAAEHGQNLAALMVTYPSTHGVFEDRIAEICKTVHDHGGQVYLDGANLNALMGLCRPYEIGADVCHMNLHKTFCIPHGGGGPGMGPIGVAAHLAPYLPDHPMISPNDGEAARPLGTIAAAPWGSPLILPISWAFIAMMGGEGLKRASLIAILNANYIAKRLDPYFPVVFKSEHGFVAHECIIDFRAYKDRLGITAEDVAKRLIDYGFHAPTMSWPVLETMMIEPTESECKTELDKFCDALISIRCEIDEIEQGRADGKDNPLKNAPHTHAELMNTWSHPYSRQLAFFPLHGETDKYWPPVARIDNVHGDRNLMCTCPPVSAFQEAAE